MQQITSSPSSSQCSRPQPAPHTSLAARCQYKPFTSTGSIKKLAYNSGSATAALSRRQLLSGSAAVLAAVGVPAWQLQPAQAQSLDDDFSILPSGDNGDSIQASDRRNANMQRKVATSKGSPSHPSLTATRFEGAGRQAW